MQLSVEAGTAPDIDGARVAAEMVGVRTLVRQVGLDDGRWSGGWPVAGVRGAGNDRDEAAWLRTAQVGGLRSYLDDLALGLR